MRYSSETIILNGGTVTGAGTGEWISVADFLEKSIHFVTSGTISAEIRISNAPNQPDDSEDEVLLGSAVTTTSIVVVAPTVRWLKVKPATVTAGSVIAYFHGNRIRTRF